MKVRWDCLTQVYYQQFIVLIKYFLVLGIREFEDKIADWVNEADEEVADSWIRQLVQHFYGDIIDEKRAITIDTDKEKRKEETKEESVLPK